MVDDRDARPVRSLSFTLVRTVLDEYRVRILLGWVLSLSVVTVVFLLPVTLIGVPQVGWDVGTTNERIQLSELRTEDTPDDETGRATQVPVTQHPELVDAKGAASDEAETASAGDDGATPDDAVSTRRSLATIATLGPDGDAPEIVGGLGALYLHIQYPEAARRNGIQGRLVLEFTVLTDGTTDHVRVLKPLHPLCDSAAVRALRTVRFAPGTREGKPVPVRMTLPVRFQLLTPSAPDVTRTADARRDRSDA